MDQIDRQIAEILQADGRASNAEIAQTVGLSVSAAGERVRRLFTAGVISGVAARLDPSAFGQDLLAFMFVDVSHAGEEEVRAALAAAPEVQEMHHVSGTHSYLLKVRVDGTADLQRFLATRVKPLAGVLRTESLVSLETVKETSAIRVDRKVRP